MLLNYRILFYNNIVIYLFSILRFRPRTNIFRQLYTCRNATKNVLRNNISISKITKDLFYIKLNHKRWVEKEGNNNLNR